MFECEKRLRLLRLQTKLYPQQIYKQQNRSKDCEIRWQTRTLRGVVQASHPIFITILPHSWRKVAVVLLL